MYDLNDLREQDVREVLRMTLYENISVVDALDKLIPYNTRARIEQLHTLLCNKDHTKLECLFYQVIDWDTTDRTYWRQVYNLIFNDLDIKATIDVFSIIISTIKSLTEARADIREAARACLKVYLTTLEPAQDENNPPQQGISQTS